MNNRATKLVCAMLCTGFCTGLAAAKTADTQEWRFKVFLDDSEIGYHYFTLTELGEGLEMRTEADFRVRFLLIPVYKYRHVNTERWDDGCLEGIESETNANGDRFAVTGSVREKDFLVSMADGDDRGEATLPGCVMTFAYWDPEFLGQPRLLNTQTGEYTDVAVRFVGDDVRTVRGESVPARRYRLTAEELEIELWYSADDEWLGLESAVGGGRRLRYELT